MILYFIRHIDNKIKPWKERYVEKKVEFRRDLGLCLLAHCPCYHSNCLQNPSSSKVFSRYRRGDCTASPEIYFWNSEDSLSFFAAKVTLCLPLILSLPHLRLLKQTYVYYLSRKTKTYVHTQTCTKCSQSFYL